MRTNFKFTGMRVNKALREYANIKVGSFSKLLHANDEEGAVCDVEFRRTSPQHNGDVCYAEINLEAGGKLYRVSKEEPTFEKAIDKVKDDILAQLRGVKEKKRTLKVRGGAKAKELGRSIA